MNDKGGRRRIADRRLFSYFLHFPERRATRFRRSCVDRRRSALRPAAYFREKRSADRPAGDQAA